MARDQIGAAVVTYATSCSNAELLTPYARLGIEPVSQCSIEATNPVAPQWELIFILM